MNLASYQPWHLLHRVRRELDTAWSPPVDVREEADRFTVQADLPGVDAKDIQITAEDGVLTIRGDRHLEKRASQAADPVADDPVRAEQGLLNFEYRERSRGSFVRRFSLPDNAHADQIKALHTNGVLEIVIPKQVAAQPKQINIEVN
jgi:HSP20 family protein